MSKQLISLSLRKPMLIYWALLIITLASGALISLIKVDTDPENMLAKNDPARVYHNQVKQEFALYDLIVVGVVAADDRSVFNPESLRDFEQLTRGIIDIDGVISKDVNALSTIDNIEQESPGSIRFDWLMRSAPADEAGAAALALKAKRLPMVVNSLVSGDEKAATIYVPIADKNESYRISNDIKALISKLSNVNEYHITGLPVAEDTFGVEMFVQMGISAPAAAVVIYLLMLYFFRSPTLVIAPMIVAMSTVIIVMGVMIGMGFTVHIMSSMIPIFLMPIAVVDSVHLMSEFADRYKPGTDVKFEISRVTQHLFQPMLFTSVTSAAGFYSLALTPIPPVQVFGLFVGSGILLAFIITILFVPAYVARMSENNLSQMQAKLHTDQNTKGLLAKILSVWGRFSVSKSRLIIIVCLLITAISFVGISKIQINDNPIRWFKSDHAIRVADRVLNQHFAGTYDAHLIFEFEAKVKLISQWREEVTQLLSSGKLSEESVLSLNLILQREGVPNLLQKFVLQADDLLFKEDGQGESLLNEIILVSEQTMRLSQQFTQPETLAYLERFQKHLLASELVGKSNSIVDLVKTVNRELRSGTDLDYQIPASQQGVAQTLLQYQSSHRPQDLWHFVTPDYSQALIWLQMTSGDNQDMSNVVQLVNDYIETNPLPEGIRIQWAGKAYLNLIWQDKMVAGMFDSLLSAFVIVFIMMAFLFRSVIYGFLAMLPLSITILFVYGLIGWTGKYYDMPIAVLSALTLGLSVDFAIHFIERVRAINQETNDWKKTVELMFEEPARAISRNALVIALGFTPLLFAPLVPYITVGVFLAVIMAISALVTLLLLPACIQQLRHFLFKEGI